MTVRPSHSDYYYRAPRKVLPPPVVSVTTSPQGRRRRRRAPCRWLGPLLRRRAPRRLGREGRAAAVRGSECLGGGGASSSSSSSSSSWRPGRARRRLPRGGGRQLLLWAETSASAQAPPPRPMPRRAGRASVRTTRRASRGRGCQDARRTTAGTAVRTALTDVGSAGRGGTGPTIAGRSPEKASGKKRGGSSSGRRRRAPPWWR